MKNKENDKLPHEIESVISNSHIQWAESKDQVWSELEKRMTYNRSPETGIERTMFTKYLAIAAGFAVLIGISFFIIFYTKSITVPSGRHAEIFLPDKSVINVNAQSTLSYKPYLWKFSRTLKFEGEAYFNVKKGNQFEVISGRGKTIVLGTSFNIYSRDNDYEVTCITGKVKVLDNKEEQNITLNPGQRTSLDIHGRFESRTNIDSQQAVSWMKDKFSFTSAPLKKVYEEIGRQYGITIDIPSELENTYTGEFFKDNSARFVLNLVSRPFDLIVVQKSDNEYIISKQQ